MSKNFQELEQKLNIFFEDKDLLVQAFCHRSFLNENPNFCLNHNERLEFLGDAVLELVTTEYLYKKFERKTEGEMTGIRAALVNSKAIAEASKNLGFNDFLLLSQGEEKEKGKARIAILADTFEAFIGALYLDKHYSECKHFIIKHLIDKKLREILEKGLDKDPKSLFQEKAQEKVSITPDYRVLDEKGPDHRKNFVVGVFIGNSLIAKARGTSKHEAEVKAAEKALIKKNW
ncbi:MAG: ribonuclease III [Candidatus Pacebacteria bacterium]|jgi:ribonuclease-3|nr:ribonuclease III [Candidatus Paceibacterota bacterium]MDD2796445.1 ribonuclease III [Candidatus Paceibacterota bacterium]MDD3047831.1 ribonuclease III [Candidatus Paceibacterota bacterium]MDD3509683.1 ribonuclease III [Candidatus Paceibacterota bacterium]MDD3918691.1 ribonuclease III [Candidatus Paceibacterota bacterium]